MEFLIIALLGAFMGRSFKFYILIPVCFIIVVVLLINTGRPDFTFFGIVRKIGLWIASLEVGYWAGLISTDLAAARQRCRSLWLRARGTHISHQARTAHPRSGAPQKH